MLTAGLCFRRMGVLFNAAMARKLFRRVPGDYAGVDVIFSHLLIPFPKFLHNCLREGR